MWQPCSHALQAVGALPQPYGLLVERGRPLQLWRRGLAARSIGGHDLSGPLEHQVGKLPAGGGLAPGLGDPVQ